MSTPQASPNQQDRPLRVFLCHASSDKPVVRDLYHRLQADGFAPWLDEEDLVAGQDWQKEIPAAVRASDIVVVCLSQDFVKEGYRQKEVRVALSVEEQKPERTIFIIPARLEPVVVPERLSQWQWVNLFQKDGYQRLVRALNLRASAIGVTMNTRDNTANPTAPLTQTNPKPTVPPATVKVGQEKPAANEVSESQPAQEAIIKQYSVTAVGKRSDRFDWNQKNYWYLVVVVIVLVTVAVFIQIGPRKGEPLSETHSLSAKAMNQIGDKYYKTEEYQQARQWYEMAAADGNIEAMWNLGVIYEFGKGVVQDYQQARQWYEKAAAAGYAAAMNRLGVLYAYGRGVTQDSRQARQWFEKAAAAGDTDAERRLQQFSK